MRCMQEHHKEKEVVQWACEALRICATNDASNRVIGENVDALVMKYFCAATNNIIALPTNNTAFGMIGVHMLSSVLFTHMSSALVAEHACRALCAATNKTSHRLEFAKKLRRDDTDEDKAKVADIVKTIRANSSSSSIISTDQDHLDLGLSGIDLVMAVMFLHMSNPDVMQQACALVKVLGVNAVICKTLGASAINAVITCIKHHICLRPRQACSIQVLTWACIALNVLLSNEDHCALLTQNNSHGILNVLLLVHTHHKFELTAAADSMLERACAAIKSMANNEDNKHIIGEFGGVRTFVEKLNSYLHAPSPVPHSLIASTLVLESTSHSRRLCWRHRRPFCYRSFNTCAHGDPEHH